MEHVKLPLTYGEGSDREWYIHDADENWIAEAVPADPGVAEEVARRIAACVNACAGIPTEMLEAMHSGPAALLPMYARLEAQRDELLAAAEVIEINAEECMDFDECTAMLVPIDDYHKLIEVVQSVKGGES